MLILNNLSKKQTCGSVEVIHGEKVVLSIELVDNALSVKNHKSGTTSSQHMLAVIDSGIEWEIKAYNNRIKVSKGE